MSCRNVAVGGEKTSSRGSHSDKLAIMLQPSLVVSILSGNLEEVAEILDDDPQAAANVYDSEKRSPLHAAAFIGEADIAEELITRGGARVMAKDNHWITPLHRACRSGAEDVVSVLLRHGADVNARDKNWQTPSHVAAANNALGCMQLMAANGKTRADTVDSGGRSCLHHASNQGHYEMAELLIERLNSSVSMADKRKRTPLHYAAHGGHADVVRLLIARGANVNAPDRDGFSPLHAAAASGQQLICQQLIEAGADLTAANAAGNTAIHVACVNGHAEVLTYFLAVLKDDDGDDDVHDLLNASSQLPLHLAAGVPGSERCLDVLVQEMDPSDVDAKDDRGRTPLMMAAMNGRIFGAKTLLANQADVDAVDDGGRTALHAAAKSGEGMLVDILLEAGADARIRNGRGQTPLHLCAAFGFDDGCTKLLPKQDDIDCLDADGRTCLHLAAYKGSVGCVELLASNKASVDVADKFGRIPLHYSAAGGWHKCTRALITAGSDVNRRDADGRTPLMLACTNNLESTTVECILIHEADISAADNKGYDALRYASASGNSDAINLMFEYGQSLCSGTGSVSAALHTAAGRGFEAAVVILLSKLGHANASDPRSGRTPLHEAAANGHANIVAYLLGRGAHVSVNDSSSRTPVHLAALGGHTDCLNRLLESTEDASVLDSRDLKGQSALMLAVAHGHGQAAELLLSQRSCVDQVDDHGRTALFRGAANGHESCVQVLLAHEASPTKRDVLGKTAFHVAAQCGQIGVLGKLLGSLENPESVHNLADRSGFTPLHWAAAEGHEGCVDVLLGSMGSAYNCKGSQFSPLHCAVAKDHDQCLHLILAQFSDCLVNIKDQKQRTLLHTAASLNSRACFDVLIRKPSVLIDIQDCRNRTPLMIACHKGHHAIVETLLEKRADIDLTDADGNTALHFACREGHEIVAGCLLKESSAKSTCISHQNKLGQTPLHLAAPQGMMDVTEVLLTKGASVTALDSKGLSPPLVCAANDDVATCLAMILSVFLSTPANSEARRSICSMGSLRLSDSSFSTTRLSEVNDATFSVDTPKRSQSGGVSDSAGASGNATTTLKQVDEGGAEKTLTNGHAYPDQEIA